MVIRRKSCIFTALFFVFLAALGITFSQTKSSNEKMSILKSYKETISDIQAQINALSDFSPDKIPGFNELGKFNQLIEKVDYSKRIFDLLIKEYNLIEDKIFPLSIEISKSYPELIKDILAELKTYYGDGEFSIIRLQKKINNIGLYIERLEMEIENLKRISEAKRKGEDESVQNIDISKGSLSDISKNIEYLKKEINRLKELLKKEQQIVEKLLEKKQKQENKIKEKLKESEELKIRALKSKNRVEKTVYITLSNVRKVRVMGLEYPRLSSAKALIYVENNKIENIKNMIDNYNRLIEKLKINYNKELKRKIIKAIIVVLIAFLIVLILLHFTKLIGEKFLKRLDEAKSIDDEQKKRYKTLISMVQTIIKVTLWGFAIMWIMGELNIDYAPFLVAAGGASLAIGFGAQSLVKDVVSGFFILLENQLSIGDVVDINGKIGGVEKINLRTVWLRSFDGSLHIIPNGQISKISNLTEKWARAVLKIGVSYDADMEKVIETINRVGKEMKDDIEWSQKIIEPAQCLGVDSFEDSSVVYLVACKTSAGSQWGVARELRKRIKEAFDKEGIEIPYPYLNVIQKG